LARRVVFKNVTEEANRSLSMWVAAQISLILYFHDGSRRHWSNWRNMVEKCTEYNRRFCYVNTI